jgi:outer membrane protein
LAHVLVASLFLQIFALVAPLDKALAHHSCGQRTTLDVLNAQQALLNARGNLVTAQRDRIVGFYALLSATGRLSGGALGLDVVAYDPTLHFDQVEDKWFGLSVPDGR